MHCAHARYVWNLAVEQHSWWTPRRGPAPSFAAQCRQLTEARAEFAWLRAGSVTVQQQALRDFSQAMRYFYGGTHRKPTWRKAGKDEGFRFIGVRPHYVRRLSKNVGEVFVPKVGWVRFRWSRLAPEAKSYRVTRDRAGRWHIAFAAIPEPIDAPGTGELVGVDRGVAVSAALSTGELIKAPALRPKEGERLLRLQRRLADAKRGSKRRGHIKSAIARLKARETDRRRDWAEKTSTDLARRFDLIRFEDLKVTNMVKSAKGTVEAPGMNVRAKAGLNRGILANGWALLLKRTQDVADVQPVRARGREVAREPSRLPVHCLRIPGARGRERCFEHRGRACRDCAGRRPVAGADEPRTPTETGSPQGCRVTVEIHARQGVEDANDQRTGAVAPTSTGEDMALELGDSQMVTITATPKDAAGQPTSDTVEWTVDNADAVKPLQVSDDTLAVTLLGAIPATGVTLTATDASGNSAPFVFDVVSGPATSLGLTAGPVTDQPPATPAG